MADVKWIKITTDIFDDEKILLIESMPSADSIIVVWFKLLAFAGKQNNDGVFLMSNKIAYTDEMLATIFRRDVNTVRMSLSVFEQFGMVEIVDNVITIPNWEKHQNLGKLEQAREQTRQRVARHRAKQKQLAECNAPCNGDVTPTEEDKEEDKDKELDIRDREKAPSKKKAKPFVPPTLEEIEAYCKERNNDVDAKRFYDYFTASDWVDSKGNKVRNWKQKVITWEGHAQNGKGRKEIVPTWMTPADTIKAEHDRMRRMMNAENDPGIAAKAEDLKKRLGV